MTRFLAKLTHWLFTLAVIVLFGLGVIRFDSSNRVLSTLDRCSGWIYHAVPKNTNPRVMHWLDTAATWFGAPPVSDAQTVGKATHTRL